MPDPNGQLPLWPFAAAQEITEVLEWRTDVLQARAGVSAHLWQYLIALLADPYRLIAVDVPGHGFARKGARGRSRLADVAADLSKLIAQEGWRHCIIVGHSAAAAVALQLAQSLPDGVTDRAGERKRP
jgi:pimeloyl-ACP methyl ester carboxylesterase